MQSARHSLCVRHHGGCCDRSGTKCTNKGIIKPPSTSHFNEATSAAGACSYECVCAQTVPLWKGRRVINGVTLRHQRVVLPAFTETVFFCILRHYQVHTHHLKFKLQKAHSSTIQRGLISCAIRVQQRLLIYFLPPVLCPLSPAVAHLTPDWTVRSVRRCSCC